jgi:hypothetical protein
MTKSHRSRARRLVVFFTLSAMMGATVPAGAAVDCLTDDEIRIVVRSVYTRAIGRVMRICADTHRELDQRAVDATTNFLTTYAEPMRRNRAAANQLMARIYQNWEEAFAQLQAQAIAGDEAWARAATASDCLDEIDKLEDMAALGDYDKVMATPRTERQFEIERAAVPRCE